MTGSDLGIILIGAAVLILGGQIFHIAHTLRGIGILLSERPFKS